MWVVGGLIALVGALCFAELTTTYPDRGGDYGYLKRAFGKRVGFAFSWTAFWVIRPANIGAMAVTFGDFAVSAAPGTLSMFQFAVAALVTISAVNLMGLSAGKLTQNLLTVAKVTGILLVVMAAFVFGSPATEAPMPMQSAAGTVESTLSDLDQSPDAESDQATAGESESGSDDSSFQWFWLAMVYVMFAFGGWNDIAFVASEVREPGRNLFRALMLGTGAVMVIYLVFNLALVWGLGFERIAASAGGDGINAPTMLVGEYLGSISGRLVALLVCASCLGAISAMIFTSPRIYWATAQDYPSLNWLAGSRDGQGWWRSMVLQALVTFAFVAIFGYEADGFEEIVIASAPYFWAFLAVTVMGLIVCRFRFGDQFEGYRTPLFPLLPVLFISACLFMVYRSTDWMLFNQMHYQAAFIAGWVVLGVILSFVLDRLKSTVVE